MARAERGARGGSGQTKPRATFSPRHEPVKFRINYRQVQGPSQYYFEEAPRPRPPLHFPYQNRESGGPDGIRTRTLEHDGFMCCRLHHGPCGHPSCWSGCTQVRSFTNGADCRNEIPVVGRTSGPAYSIRSAIECCMRRKTKVLLVREGSEERLRLLRINRKAPTISALMRILKHVTSSGPYTRDEMNER
jgi:hypothetical protein